jgi:hypothetical protein
MLPADRDEESDRTNLSMVQRQERCCMTELERYDWYQGDPTLEQTVEKLLPLLRKIMDRAGIPEELRVPLANLMVELAEHIPEDEDPRSMG